MRSYRIPLFMMVVVLLLGLALPMVTHTAAAATSAAESKKLIYDQANLLRPQEEEALTRLARQYAPERQTDFIIYTTNNPEGRDVVKMTEDLYDRKAFGYNQPYGNAVILTMDMYNREIYLAGFGKAEQELNDSRLDKIRNKITPDLAAGNYGIAFEKYIELSYDYMGYKFGTTPDNLLFQLWFQLLVAAAIGGGIVWTMAYRSGGVITVSRATYEDSSVSGVLDSYDNYTHTTVSKRKIEKSSSSGGGGGTSSGGHSHSGSRGSF